MDAMQEALGWFLNKEISEECAELFVQASRCRCGLNNEHTTAKERETLQADEEDAKNEIVRLLSIKEAMWEGDE